MTFEFATAGRIRFGAGVASDVPGVVAGLGRHVLIVTGRASGRHAALVEAIVSATTRADHLAVDREPTVDDVRVAAAGARSFGADVVVAIGGGSAIDAAKAIAALATNPGDVLDYLEVVGAGRPLVAPPLPVVAVPTTAGTGAEVTRNAVLGVPDQHVKVSLRSPLMYPRVALVDPVLTLGVPPGVTRSTGLDALAQLVEPFVSVKATPLSDAMCRAGLGEAARGLETAVRAGDDITARTQMSFASLCGGLALANSGLGLAHGLAAPLGGLLGASHGDLVAALLAPVMAANIRALRARAPDGSALVRYEEIARVFTGTSNASAEDGVVWLRALVARLGVRGLASLGLAESAVGGLVDRSTRASSTAGNPIALTPTEIAAVVADAS